MRKHAWRLALVAIITATAAGASTNAVLAAHRAAACRQALAAELGGLRLGISVYSSDPAACRPFTRAQQRAWLEQDLARQVPGA